MSNKGTIAAARVAYWHPLVVVSEALVFDAGGELAATLKELLEEGERRPLQARQRCRQWRWRWSRT